MSHEIHTHKSLVSMWELKNAAIMYSTLLQSSAAFYHLTNTRNDEQQLRIVCDGSQLVERFHMIILLIIR